MENLISPHFVPDEGDVIEGHPGQDAQEATSTMILSLEGKLALELGNDTLL